MISKEHFRGFDCQTQYNSLKIEVINILSLFYHFVRIEKHFFVLLNEKNDFVFFTQDYRDQIETSAMDLNETRVRDELIQSQLIVFTPSRYNNGKRLTNYDDR